MTATATTPRKHTRFTICDNHAWLRREGRHRRAEFFAEGGPTDGPCGPGRCRAWAGTDLFIPDACHGEYVTDWGVNR